MINKKKTFSVFLLFTFIPIISLLSAPFGYSVKLFGVFDLSVIVSAVWILAAATVALFYLIIKSDISDALRITGIIFLSIFTAVLIWLSALIVFASQFTEKTVADRIISPEGTRIAEIIDSDQGALGGNTVVYVKNIYKTDFLVFSIRKNKRIYIGELKEKLDIEWKNEDCLIINSKEYITE